MNKSLKLTPFILTFLFLSSNGFAQEEPEICHLGEQECPVQIKIGLGLDNIIGPQKHEKLGKEIVLRQAYYQLKVNDIVTIDFSDDSDGDVTAGVSLSECSEFANLGVCPLLGLPTYLAPQGRKCTLSFDKSTDICITVFGTEDGKPYKLITKQSNEEFSSTSTKTYEDGLNEGIAKGIAICQIDPTSCGITVPQENEGIAKGIAICQNDPASCGITVPQESDDCPSVDTHASFSPSDGTLTIPVVDVPDTLGGVTTYRAEMSLEEGQGLLFSVTKVEPVQ
ncbi:MAG: hypothetical protein KAI83_10890 [Thiomargarita sp.]|nr:hypothetical protein [Thiomargarita sp.]